MIGQKYGRDKMLTRRVSDSIFPAFLFTLLLKQFFYQFHFLFHFSNVQDDNHQIAGVIHF